LSDEEKEVIKELIELKIKELIRERKQ